MRWVHSTELLDPTPWLSGGELILYVDSYRSLALAVNRALAAGGRAWRARAASGRSARRRCRKRPVCGSVADTLVPLAFT